MKGSSAQWRAPVALQIVFALVMIFGIGFLPDSPLVCGAFRKQVVVATYPYNTRLVNQGRYAEALAVISALEDKHHNHPDVQRTFLAIREAALAEHTVSERVNYKISLISANYCVAGGRRTFGEPRLESSFKHSNRLLELI